MATMIDETLADDTGYVVRLLQHAAGQDVVARNRLYQMSLMLARCSLEQQEPDFERDLTNVLFECIRLQAARPKAASKALR